MSDIGGTTTDIAYLRDGAPGLNADGAYVGGWRTMVEAADIRTSGLGGDSEVTPQNRGLATGLQLGPRRAIPLCLLARDWPQALSHLEAQWQNPVPQATDGRFVMPMMPQGIPDWLSKSEARFAQAILDSGTTALSEIATSQVALGAVERLIARGLVALSAFTPTDAAHVLGLFDEFEGQAARLGAQLLSRRKMVLARSMVKVLNQSLKPRLIRSLNVLPYHCLMPLLRKMAGLRARPLITRW